MKFSMLGDVQLLRAYTPGQNYVQTNDLTFILQAFEVLPNLVTLYDRATLQRTTTYAISSIGGGIITFAWVDSGTDQAFAAGDLVLLTYADDDSGSTPYASPAFTAFALSGQSTLIEVGATISGSSRTFSWSTSNSSNVAALSIAIADTTGGSVLASSLPNTGTDTLTFTDITKTVPATQVWTISAQDTHGNAFNKTFSVNWDWRVYAGTNSSSTLTANQVKGLSDFSSLEAAFAGTYTYASSLGYKYFSYPDSMGSVSSFTDATTGFPISMADSSDDAAYSNMANGWSYAIVSVINAQGVATDYRVYRTANSFSGDFSLRVS